MAPRLVLAYENFAANAVLSGGSWLAALPLTNLQSDNIGVPARSTNATNAATQFKVDLGAPKQIDVIALGPCNLSPGATWRMRAYSDAAYSSEVYDTGLQVVDGEVIDWSDSDAWLEWEDSGFWLGVSDFAALIELPQYNFHVVPEDQRHLTVAAYWHLEVFDDANAAGYVDVGYLMVAAAFRPSLQYADNNMELLPLTDVEESLGGRREFWERGPMRRAFRCEFKSLPKNEVFGDVMRMALRAGVSRPVFIAPNPDDSVHGARRSFLATLKKPPPLVQARVARGATAIDVEELL